MRGAYLNLSTADWSVACAQVRVVVVGFVLGVAGNLLRAGRDGGAVGALGTSPPTRLDFWVEGRRVCGVGGRGSRPL